MEPQPQPCTRGMIDSYRITSSYNTTTLDNHVDNRIDYSTRNFTSNTTIFHTNALVTEDQPEYSQKCEIFNWLAALSFSNKHIDIFNRHKVGTGQWLLEDDVFQGWVRGGKRILLCQGIPGAGKSTLASIAIHYLETKFKDDETVAISYIYCDYKEQMQQTAASLINSLLWQIAVSSKQVFYTIRALYKKHKEKFTKPPQTEFLQALKVALLAFTKVFIIVDAVDEMVDSERNKFLKECKGLIEVKGVQLLILSRPTGQLTAYFEGSAQMELRAQDSDIMAYLDEQIQYRHELATLIKRNPNLRKEITTVITGKAQGMFLLARFHLEEVATANTKYELDKRLRDLPSGLDNTYASAFERIIAQGATKANLAKEAILWITYSLRPIEIRELQHALAIKGEDMKLDENSLIFPERILSACGGLVILNDKSRIIRLVHYTTQDYFLRKGSKLLNQAPHSTIAAACIKYLSIGPDIYTRFWSDQKQYCFLLYAAKHWGHHARKASKLPALLEKQIHNFLRELEEVIELWAVKKFWDLCLNWKGNDLDAPPGLVAAIFGLYEIVQPIIEGEPCPGLGQWWEDAIYYALREGYEDVLNLLVEKAVNVKAVVSGQRAIYKAIEMGRGDILRLLLEKGAKTEADWSKDSPLLQAVGAGHEDIVRLLLERGANVEARVGWDGITPLCKAVAACYEGIVRLLLWRGGSTEARYGHGGVISIVQLRARIQARALFRAVRTGHEGVVRQLLEGGANIEARSDWGKETPLLNAVRAGHEDIVRLLLERSANMESRSGWDEVTPLGQAVKTGHAGIVLLLLEKGANMEAKSGWGEGTPLARAVEAGHEGIVRLLLEKGANMEARSGWDEKTPLLKAVAAGHEGIVRLLLEKGANMQACTGSRWGRVTSLLKAIWAGHECIVRLLLEKGAYTEALMDRETPLFEAVETGHEGIVRLLLEKDEDMQLTELGETYLRAAAVRGHTSVVRVLLEKGVSLQVSGGMLLSLAARYGRMRLVRVLLEKGVDVNTPVAGTVHDETAPGTHTALSSAIYGGHVGIVHLLLELGADTNIGDVSPSSKTSPAVRDMIKELLLAKGATGSADNGIENEIVNESFSVQSNDVLWMPWVLVGLGVFAFFLSRVIFLISQ